MDYFTGRFSQSTIHLFLVKVEMFCSWMKIDIHFPQWCIIQKHYPQVTINIPGIAYIICMTVKFSVKVNIYSRISDL